MSNLPGSTTPDPILSNAGAAAGPSPWRYFWRTALVLLVLTLMVVAGAMWYASTPEFEIRVRQKLVSVLEQATGGRVELGALHWRVLHLEVEADNLTIHGLEAANEAPYAHADRLYLRAKIISLLSAKIGLNFLEADRPAIHLIVYPDGTTNQPRPKTVRTSHKSVTDTLFDLAVDRTEVKDGVALINQRAIPFNLAANNLGVTIRYVPAAILSTADHYDGTIHVEDLAAQRAKDRTIHSKLDLQVELGRNEANLQSLRLQTEGSMLEASGSVVNFANPEWKTAVRGNVDIRAFEALAEIPGLTRGMVELQVAGQGSGHNFTIDGQSKLTDGAYHVGSVHETGVNVKTALHITQDEVALTGIQARLVHGGAIDGTLRIQHWLNTAPAPEPLATRAVRGTKTPPPGVIQQQGTIRATVSGMTLAYVMSVVVPPAYHDLGFDTVASGPVTVDWTGNADRLVAGAKLTLMPSSRPVPGQVPLSGSVDAQYLNASGTVKIRDLTAETPGMQLHVTGALGVYPIERASEMDVELTTANLGEFDRTLTTLGLAAGDKTGVQAIPVALHGQAQFQGTVTRSILAPDVKGHLTATNFDLVYSLPEASRGLPEASVPKAQSHGTAPPVATTVSSETAAPVLRTIHWDSVDAQAEYAPELIAVQQAVLVHGATAVHLSGELRAHHITARRSAFDKESEIELDAKVQKAALSDVLTSVGQQLPVTGTVDLDAHATGQLNNLSGSGHLAVQGGSIYGELYKSLNTDLRFVGQEIDASHLIFSQNGGKVTGDGGYNISTDAFHFSAQGTGFELAHIQRLKSLKYPVSGLVAFETHGDGTLKQPVIEANLHMTQMNVADAVHGYMDANAHTQNGALIMDVNAHMTNAAFQVHGQTQLSGDYQTKAHLTLSNLDVDPILETLSVRGIKAHSNIVGSVDITGPLKEPRKLSGDATIQQFALALAGVPLKSEGAVHATLINGRLHLDPFHITGDDTDLRAQGSAGLFGGTHDLDLHANGSVNMKLGQTFDPDITSSGHMDFNVDAEGTFQRPGLTGQVKFTNVAMALQDFPNGLSQMNGTLVFDQDRLDVKELTATSGGGLLKLGGFITYQQGLYGDLNATAKDVRIRYPQGVSSMADARLRLQGTQSSLLLSGNVTITRFAISSDLDMAAFNSMSSVTLPPTQDSPSSRLRLDIHIVSAPQLDFQNSYAKLAGDVNLRVRGTLAQPSVLGHITVTEGSATFAGTKYELQHGDIYFSNPVRIEPTIDLNATAHVEDYDVTIGLTGTPSKLTPTFRSEPPLSEQDIFSLLALGRTQEEQQIYSAQQQSAGVNSTADALLGGALNATVSSRIQKLFGGGSVKIDPTFVSGTGNSTARITVEQQLAKNATLTYATNVNSTAQQLIQGQVNITQNVSLLAVRDENGVFSLVFKIRHRYK